MALNDYEWSYRGLTLGPAHTYGFEFIDGLESLAVDRKDHRIPRSHGEVVGGLHTVLSKDIRANIFITGAKRSAALSEDVAEVLAAFQGSSLPVTYPLAFKEPGMPERYINVRVVGITRQRNPSTTHGRQAVLVRFTAADPRIYSMTEKVQLCQLYDPSGGGRDYGVDYDEEYTYAATTEYDLPNDGDANAYPVIAFNGPTAGAITEVTLLNRTTGQELVIATPLAIAEVLTADMHRVVTGDTDAAPYVDLDGVSAWGDWELPRDPFYLVPGSNLLRYTVTGGATAATVGLTYRDTWL